MAGSTHGPLAGVRIIEFDAMGAVPFACLILADFGCDIVRIRRSARDGSVVVPQLFRGRSEVTLDLETAEGRDAALALIAEADAVIEGSRAGAMEAIGLGPEACLARNPRLVYARSTGWGQSGELAGTAGNDINYLALSGVLHAFGPAEAPVPPLNLIGEYASGALMLALGTVSAVLSAQATGRGQVIDAAICDGSALLMSLCYALHGAGRWADARASNLVDGGAPFYRTYRCADGRHIAVGAIEPPCYAALCAGLGIPEFRYPQYDRACWAAMAREFSERFASRTRDQWAAAFRGTMACVTPVLALAEAPRDPHHVSRRAFLSEGGAPQPAPAPRFSASPAERTPAVEESAEAVLARWR